MKSLRLGRTAATLFAFVSVIGVSSPVGAAPASSRAATARDVVNIHNLLNNKCLEIRDSNIENGAYVGMWDCWGGATTNWYWDGDQLRNMLNHKCLEVRDSNADNGAYASMWDCWGGATTRWYTTPAGV
jgi:hypothetical protein